MTRDTILAARDEAHRHLTRELLPFWLTRCRDDANGGFITHFDRHGRDTGEDQKSLIAQTRSVFTMASAHRAGYGGGVCAEFARHGVDFLLDRMWDREHGGF
jgi:mannose 2-epimerase